MCGRVGGAAGRCGRDGVAEATHNVLEVLHVVANVLLGLVLTMRDVQIRRKVDQGVRSERLEHSGHPDGVVEREHLERDASRHCLGVAALEVVDDEQVVDSCAC